jgi:predicted ferric reductase
LALAAVLWIPLPGFRTFHQWILKTMKGGSDLNYDRSKMLHRTFILLIGGILLLHITEAELVSSVSPLSKILYWLLYGSSFGLFLLSHSKAFRVKSEVLAIEEKQGIITIHLQPEKSIRYQSGQFTFLKVDKIAKGREEHPFSFLSHSPSSEDKSKIEPVSVAVRAVGDFTGNLIHLKPGDSVHLGGSYGNFRPGKEKALCFIASGIGTVPILSIFKELHSKGDTRKIQLFLAVNHEDELPERVKILELVSHMENVQAHLMVYNKASLRFSEEFFREKLTDYINYSYYLCSSPGVRNLVFNALRNMGIKKSSIHYEAFFFS